MHVCSKHVNWILFQEKCPDSYMNITKSKMLQAKSTEHLEDHVSVAQTHFFL